MLVFLIDESRNLIRLKSILRSTQRHHKIRSISAYLFLPVEKFCLSLRCTDLVCMFNQENFVAGLAIDQLVNKLFGHKHPEPAGTYSLGCSILDM
jgi:hypothetical protein